MNARRVATCYDKTAESFRGFTDITSIRMWFGHLSTWPKWGYQNILDSLNIHAVFKTQIRLIRVILVHDGETNCNLGIHCAEQWAFAPKKSHNSEKNPSQSNRNELSIIAVGALPRFRAGCVYKNQRWDFVCLELLR